MAIRFPIILCLVLVLSISLAMDPVSCTEDVGRGDSGGTVPAISTANYNRKILVSSDELLRGLRRSAASSLGERNFSWELRKVPSGPDPLHHNRGPKKPQTP